MRWVAPTPYRAGRAGRAGPMSRAADCHDLGRARDRFPPATRSPSRPAGTIRTSTGLPTVERPPSFTLLYWNGNAAILSVAAGVAGDGQQVFHETERAPPGRRRHPDQTITSPTSTCFKDRSDDRTDDVDYDRVSPTMAQGPLPPLNRRWSGAKPRRLTKFPCTLPGGPLRAPVDLVAVRQAGRADCSWAKARLL